MHRDLHVVEQKSCDERHKNADLESSNLLIVSERALDEYRVQTYRDKDCKADIF